MKRFALILLLSGAMASGTVLAQFQGASDHPTPIAADRILSNAKILTPQGWASAVAIANGTIVGVGDEATLAPYHAARTQVIDLAGATVLPGLYDMHVHPVVAGLEQNACQFAQDSRPAQILATVKSCVALAASGDWVTGGLWVAESFGRSPPSRGVLDEVAPHTPVLLREATHHSIWVNSAALKAAGITRNTPNPPGGVIEKDRHGDPTGILREAATLELESKVPVPRSEAMAAALRWSLREMLSFGITGFEDALVTTPYAQAYATLADSGELIQHVRGCIWQKDQGLILSRGLYRRPHFDPSCIKFILDGVPTDARTAAMTEPYANAKASDDAQHRNGFLLFTPAELNADVSRFDAMGLTVKMHAAGDAAVHAALDAIAAARQANGPMGMPHEVAHNNFVLPSDITRARSLGATLEFSPYLWFPSPPIDAVTKVVGAARMERFTPVKDALDARTTTLVGSDWPVVPSVSPWLAIETLVTRRAPGGAGPVLSPGQQITVAQAVDLFTRAAARQMGLGDQVGTIEPGKQADLVIIDRNIFDVAPTDIHNTRVLRTFVAGNEVYSQASKQ